MANNTPSWEQTVQRARHRRGNTPRPGTADTPAPAAAKKAPAKKAAAKKAPAKKAPATRKRAR